MKHDFLLVSFLLLVYSFETFIPYEINRASREKDKSKILTLGPFACALEEIVKYAH
jgi:hypothetical protein